MVGPGGLGGAHDNPKYFPKEVKGHQKRFSTSTLPGLKRAIDGDQKSERIVKENDDVVFSGSNRQGFRCIVASDGMSKSFRGMYMAGKLKDAIINHSGSNIKSLMRAIKIGQENAYDDAQDENQGRNSAATLLAGVIDKDNRLWMVNYGDSRAFLVRNGRVLQLNIPDDPRRQEIENLMSEEKNITRTMAGNMAQSKNKPISFESKYRDPTRIEEKNVSMIQLQLGDQLYFITDGVLDGACETWKEFEKTLIDVSKAEYPAKQLVVASLNGWNTNHLYNTRDDMSAAYMKI